MLLVVVARSYSDDSVIHYVLPVLFLHNGANGSVRQMAAAGTKLLSTIADLFRRRREDDENFRRRKLTKNHHHHVCNDDGGKKT